MILTQSEKRDVYYIYRAMHDKVCPNCGSNRVDALFCYDCSFEISEHEAQAIRRIGVDAIKERLATFQRVRSQL